MKNNVKGSLDDLANDLTSTGKLYYFTAWTVR